MSFRRISDSSTDSFSTLFSLYDDTLVGLNFGPSFNKLILVVVTIVLEKLIKDL